MNYPARRQQLAERLDRHGLILIPGNGEAPMNYAGNDYPFRQDSTFLYLTGIKVPDLVLTIDAKSGESKLWGEDVTLDHVVWMGEQPSLAERAAAIGATYGGNLANLAELTSKSDHVFYLPPYRGERRELLTKLTGTAGRNPSIDLIRAVVELRSVKSAEELAEMTTAVKTSLAMHIAAREMAAPGMREAEVAGHIEGMAISAGGRLAYPAIVTRNGQVLHNHYYGNELRAGDLLLIDAGAEAPSGYAGDLTRTFPVGKKADERQAAILNIVARAKDEAVDLLRPGLPFRNAHDLAATVIAAGLKEMGLMKGDPAEAAAVGAAALFFPHGLGHMIGLDVHDMEDLGEDYVGYDEEISRSEQFGTRNLRLGRRLREGFTLTVEPGCYFIPPLIDSWRAEGRHADFIDYGALEDYRTFGGIRLEDNYVITADGAEDLGTRPA